MSSPFEGTLALDAQRTLPHNRVSHKERRGTPFALVGDFARNPRKHARLLFSRIGLLFRLVKDPETPWPAKLAASLCLSYVVSPIQLIPNFIPIIGQTDDVFAIWLAMKAITKCTPRWVLAKHMAISTTATFTSETENLTPPPPILVRSVSADVNSCPASDLLSQ
jgi:uncharacterized membrane protein YkvA (DUF1232 family)